ncbi:hypothetical protein [Chengkuizengella axinellae]|uniref:Phospholipase C/D domain-containing protein n=1 Tax=Chengkuizengella axinellae TaxID=3064388 RepID=A0ABT9J221_9BACL|nr:hypothetical protein [Chengkuizengella sp. 2205SS18-9]MDP5275664.1 hypothetical protein [Chengkuizengella sp. 2205SS18-9]
MPWPMTHFSVAFQYLEHPDPAFLLGSIAPDAVLVRDNDIKGKVKSHLGKNPNIEDYFNFIRINKGDEIIDQQYSQFLLGYIAHIFVDLKWAELKLKISNHDVSLKDRLWQEENQMDFHLYRTVEWKNQLVKDIKNSPLLQLDGLYEINELEKWRHKIFEWLENPNHEPKIQNEYITMDRVDSFVKQSTEDLKELFHELQVDLDFNM